MSRVFLSIFALLAVGCGAANIQPNQYTLQLLIDTDTDAFSGRLVIDAKVLIPGATDFVLHNHGLNISTVSVVQQGGVDVYKTMTGNADDQYTMISLTQGLTTDHNVQIVITYQGQVSTDPTGLFSFWDSGKKFYMTNFYPIYARKVFPCIDEPGTAAQIALTVIVTKNIGGIIASTQKLNEVIMPNGYTMYELSTTVPIAPYSLFFTLGDWKGDVYNPPAPSKLWLPPSLQGQTGNIDPNMVGALKTSNISLFLSGFIQNLNIFVAPVYEEETYSGLNTIVLRKDVLMKNAQETTTEMERDHLLKITYAVWKMFFGTAVRPADWGNNWLSTSIPTYLAYKILDEPQFAAVYGTADENLVSGLYEKVFDTSSAADSPVTYLSMAPTKPKDILSFVRSSGVEKGVYALKTIESFVDPALLKSWLFAFIRERNNTAVDTATFIVSIGTSTNPTTLGNLTDVMMPILSQSGYPLVNLTRNAGTLDIFKSNFNKVGNRPSRFSQLADASSWELPITATTSMNPNPANATVLFFKAGANNQIEIGTGYPDNGWALLNLDGKGMLRTSYDYLSWSLFATAANTTFSPATRAKLVADAFAAAESQVQSWTATLKYMEALDSETHLAPWKAALAGFKRMWSWIYYTGSSKNTNTTGQINLVEPFKTYVRTRLNNMYQKLGPIGNNDDTQDYLRREIVAAMCEYGDSNCVSNLTAQYNAMSWNQGKTPSNDLLSVVVCNGLREANISTWTAAFNNYIYSGSWFPQPLLNSHYSFLACPDSDNNEYSEAISSFLSTVFLNVSGKAFPQDQILPAMSEILDKPQHVDQVVRFFVENQSKFNLSTGMQAEMVMEIGKRLTSPTQTAMLSAFLKDHNVTSDMSAAVNASIAAGNTKAQYILSIQGDVQAALIGENPTTAPPTGSTGSSTGTTGTGTGTSIPITTVPPPPSTTPGAASATAVSIAALLVTLAVALAAQ